MDVVAVVAVVVSVCSAGFAFWQARSAGKSARSAERGNEIAERARSDAKKASDAAHREAERANLLIERGNTIAEQSRVDAKQSAVASAEAAAKAERSAERAIEAQERAVEAQERGAGALEKLSAPKPAVFDLVASTGQTAVLTNRGGNTACGVTFEAEGLLNLRFDQGIDIPPGNAAEVFAVAHFGGHRNVIVRWLSEDGKPDHQKLLFPR